MTSSDDNTPPEFSPARDNRGRFLTGAGGNPEGISTAKRKLRDLALSFAPDIIAGFYLVFRDPNQKMKDRIDAGNIVLLRGLGHPTTTKEENAEQLSMVELERTLPKLIVSPEKPYDINDMPEEKPKPAPEDAGR